MADLLIELTRVDAEPRGTSVVVNLAQVAWIEPGAEGTSHIVFAVAMPRERAAGVSLTIDVRESVEEIAVLAGIVRKADHEAIAQAWSDQSARRGIEDGSN